MEKEKTAAAVRKMKKKVKQTVYRKICGFANYHAGNDGRIYISDKYGNMKQLTLFLSPNSKYLRVYLTKNRVKENHFVHNVIGCAFSGNAPGGKNYCHRDGNPLNNAPDNLEEYAEPTVRAVKSRIDKYRIEELESELKSRCGSGAGPELWQRYYGIKSTASARNAMNWLKMQLRLM
ncbi:MAG: HNH endonuclease [Ignavibacteria bacterium]|nr:HNH endonuclease [Ignavibacteria bacterium]